MMPEMVIGAAAVLVLSATLWLLLRSERNADDAVERALTIARRVNEGPEHERDRLIQE
jgi:hypothetical protein